jgi:colanic acid biosynthesis glycosyl transferase WcaI
MRVLILNQYFPPDPAPTGVLFAELAGYLRAQGHDVELISTGQTYRSGQGQRGRLKREAQGLLKILRQGLLARRADAVISGSSPPCLLVVATLIALRHRAKSYHWAMDLYPELAVALGEVAPGRLAGALQLWMHYCYRLSRRVVVLDEDMAAQIQYPGATPEIIRPWVNASVLQCVDETDLSVKPPSAPWVWIYSGNLGRAHEWETLLEVQARLEREGVPVTLRFQGGGPSWVPAREKADALGLTRCEWLPYVEECELPASLLRCQIEIVTQRPETRGLLWPSKLALLLSLRRPILWVGPEGAIANLIRTIPRSGVFQPGEIPAIAAWLRAGFEDSHPVSQPAVNPGTHREKSLQAWAHLIADSR